MEINDIQGNYGDGWIKIFRSIRKHWIWEDANKLKWWLDILLEVNHADKKVNIGYDLFDCKMGQSIMSRRSWAKRWNVSKTTVDNFFKLLEKDNMIEIKSLSKTSQITVCNYVVYQQIQTKEKPKKDQTKDTTVLKQERKELKKGKKEFIIPELSEIETYFDTNGYKKDAAKKFHLYYTETKWINKNGKPIENWKLTAQSVWFNEKNKKPERILPI